MSHPLPKHEDRSLDLERERHRLEWRSVSMLPQIADQPLITALIFASPPCCGVRDTGSTHHGEIITHPIDQPHKTVVEQINLAVFQTPGASFQPRLPPAQATISASFRAKNPIRNLEKPRKTVDFGAM